MEKVVFTNGCFDILHPGHLDLLARARALGTKLIVGINSDESVRKIKGYPRPFMSQNDRALMLQGLASVDEVRIFDEPTPQKIIEDVKPDVLVKGGDWQINEIIGADVVLKNGGEVFSLPLKGDFSSSQLVEQIQLARNASDNVSFYNIYNNRATITIIIENSLITKVIENSLNQHLQVFQNIIQTDIANIEQCAELIYQTLCNGKKILFCGNGGSAADAQHLAAEFGGRYETERRAFPAIALTTDTSGLTAIANDYGFERVFTRQIEALANAGDLLIAISTSGNSPNIISAVMTAREKGCQTIGMTGKQGKKLASLCDATILVPSNRTARIQEAHITIGHIWCEIIDARVEESLN